MQSGTGPNGNGDVENRRNGFDPTAIKVSALNVYLHNDRDKRSILRIVSIRHSCPCHILVGIYE